MKKLAIIIIILVNIFTININLVSASNYENIYYLAHDGTQNQSYTLSENVRMVKVEITNVTGGQARTFICYRNDYGGYTHQNYLSYYNNWYGLGQSWNGSYTHIRYQNNNIDVNKIDDDNILVSSEMTILYDYANYDEGTDTGDVTITTINNGTTTVQEYNNIVLGNSTQYIDVYYTNATVKIYSSQPSTKDCIPYQIEIDHLSETLVQDNTWLHNIFYGDHGWESAWRYAMTAKAFDNQRRPVPGVLTPIPGNSFGYEHYSILQWPPRQYKLLADLPLEEYLQTFRIMGEQHPLTGFFNMSETEPFTNLYFVGEGEYSTRANEYIHFIFVPDITEEISEEEWYHIPTSFTMNLDEFRGSARDAVYDSQYQTPWWPEWDSPYHQQAYTYKFTHIVDCNAEGLEEFEPSEWHDKEWTDWREMYDDLPPGALPGVGIDDRTRIDDNLSDLVITFEDFKETLSGKAPFGYVVAIFDELDNYADGMDDSDLNLTILTSQLDAYDENIIINLTESRFSALFEAIRKFSSWMLYMSLGLFFYREYRTMLQGGSE